MVDALVAGVIAGYGIAVPVGPIALLIFQAGVRHGFGQAAAAGAGAASADGLYATVALFFGAVATTLLAPVLLPTRLVGAAVLMAIGLRSLRSARSAPVAGHVADRVRPNRLRTYLAFLGLTIINPMTFLYFSALVLGLPAVAEPGARVLFVVGAFGASLSWQLVIASLGSGLHGRLSDQTQRQSRIVGGAIVLVFAAVIAIQALSAATR